MQFDFTENCMFWFMKTQTMKIKTILYPLMIVLGFYMLLYLYTDNILSENPYNSYTKQCISWLNGRLDLGRNYTWLELAVFEGKYFVSSPPFPSYVFLPFTLIFGENNPESFLNIIIALIGVVYCTFIASEYKLSKLYTAMLPVFLYTGGAVFQIVLPNGVWFIAQNMSLTLTLMSIYYAKKSRKGLSVFLLCCASGCRPFQILYLPLIVYIYMCHSHPKKIKPREYFLDTIYVFIPTAILTISYLLLNFFRFGNFLEFGHNYLPEFTRSEHGQFSFIYILENMPNLFRLPKFNVDTRMQIPQFNGMNIFICFPIIIWYIYITLKAKAFSKLNLLVVVTVVIHIVFLLSHKTLGGYHYGNRYIIDVLPAIFTAVCATKLDIKNENFFFFQALLLFGLGFNVIGYYQFLTM